MYFHKPVAYRQQVIFKKWLHKRNLIKLFTQAHWSQSDQSHTSNGYFKLVHALLLFHSYFFLRGMKTRSVPLSHHCLAASTAKTSAFNSVATGVTLVDIRLLRSSTSNNISFLRCSFIYAKCFHQYLNKRDEPCWIRNRRTKRRHLM